MNLSIFTLDDLKLCKELLGQADDTDIVLNVINQLENEIKKRDLIEESVKELIEFNDSYVKYSCEFGINCTKFFKVGKIYKSQEDGYINIFTDVEICIIDGTYSIEEASVITIKPDSIKNIEKIDEDTYKSEFRKAIEYYKTLI